MRLQSFGQRWWLCFTLTTAERQCMRESCSCAPTLMINCGQIFTGFLAAYIGKTKYQCMTVLTVGGAFVGGEHGRITEHGFVSSFR